MQLSSRHSAAPLVALLLTLAAWSLPARSMVIDCGPNVCYQYDEAQAGMSSFGAPVRVGDEMQFLPPALLVASAGGIGPLSLSVAFVFDRIFSVAGGEILSFGVFEEGDYEIIGSGSVGASLALKAESNLAAEEVVAAALFSASGDSGLAQIWTTEATLAPAAGFAGPAHDIRLTITNLLEASAPGLGDLAWVQKKFVVAAGDIAPPTAVPVPGTLWLLATGAGLCGWLAERRKGSRTGAHRAAGQRVFSRDYDKYLVSADQQLANIWNKS